MKDWEKNDLLPETRKNKAERGREEQQRLYDDPSIDEYALAGAATAASAAEVEKSRRPVNTCKG